MADNEKQQINAPKDAKVPVQKDSGQKIFVMPEKYRGAKDQPMVLPKEEKPKQMRPQTPPLPPKKPLTPARPPMPPKKGGKGKILVIVGAVVIVGLSIGGYFMVTSIEPEPTIPEVPTRPTTPTTPTEPTTPTLPTTPTEPTTPTTPEQPFPQAVSPGIDSDSDGLTDIEEEQIYQTDPRKPDSDLDGFLDGNEVFHRYNPNGTAPGTLLGSGLVKEYIIAIDSMNFTVLYPTAWELKENDSEEKEVIFIAPTQESVSVKFLEKESTFSIRDWFTSIDAEAEVISSVSKNGYSMLITQDQLTAYLDGGSFVAVINLNTGVKGTIDYLQTFQMMLNSVDFLPVEEE